MITLYELKNKIAEIEEEINDKGLSIDEVSINIDYMHEFKDIQLEFICDGYYGTFVRMDVS